MTDFGRRGGTGPTAGRVASTYEAELPDGRVVRKRSFHIHQPEALLGCYQDRAGNWHASGIVAEERDWGRQKFIVARRVA